MDKDQADILVIGAGPAGCAAGIIAANAGLKVVVIDQAFFPRQKICGDCITNKGALLIDELTKTEKAIINLPHAVIRKNLAIFPDGTSITRNFNDSPGYVVPRYYLDNLMRQALEDSGAILTQGARVKRLKKNSRGSICGAESDYLSWTAKAVIVADGAGSIAWKTLDIKPRQGKRTALAITSYYKNIDFAGETNSCEHYFEDDLPGGYFWIFPPVDGISNIGVYQNAYYYKETGVPIHELLNLYIDRHKTRFQKAQQVSKPKCWPLPHAVKPFIPCIPGMLICGDAGCFIDPFTGEGIWQALHTGKLAGTIVSEMLDNNAGGLDEKSIKQYGRLCYCDILKPSKTRVFLQHAMRIIVKLQLYKLPITRKILQWGYSRESLEMSKKLR